MGRKLESVTIAKNVGASSKKQGNPGLKLSDIARLAGVSVTTASYVINGKAAQQRISSATVERVRAATEKTRELQAAYALVREREGFR